MKGMMCQSILRLGTVRRAGRGDGDAPETVGVDMAVGGRGETGSGVEVGGVHQVGVAS